MNYEPIPSELLRPGSAPGALLRFDYTTETYDDTHAPVQKDALVYLPCGYEEQPETRYPVLFLMHGGGGNSDEFFGGLEAATPLKNLLDNCMANGRMQPAIVVAPSYLVPGYEEARHEIGIAQTLTHRFPTELVNDLLPAIDAAFRTIPHRKSRAFGGFSMGAECTWSVLADASKQICTVMPLSGDYWAIALKGGKDHPEETVDALLTRMQQHGAVPGENRVLAFTGDHDIAYEAMDPMLHALARHTDWFADIPLAYGGSLDYCLKENGWHTYNDCYEYLYLAMPWLFDAETVGQQTASKGADAPCT